MSPRLRLLLSLNLVCVAILAWQVLPGDEVPAHASEQQPELDPDAAGSRANSTAQATARDETSTLRNSDRQVSSREPIQAPASPPTRFNAVQLQRGIERAIANAVAKARKLSKGQVHGNNSTVAVLVRELGADAELVAIQSNVPQVPASNMKIVTAAAALELLGSNWSFETPFEAAGTISSGQLHGDLIVRAGGDPLYDVQVEGALDRWLDPLAQSLRAQGVRSVSGALILDEGVFADPVVPHGWPSPKQHWRDYCALSGGFSANAGCLTAYVQPTSVDSQAHVTIRPRDYGLRRVGKVLTVSGNRIYDLAIGATPSAVTVQGQLGIALGLKVERFAHPDPVALFGAAIVGGLERRGIKIAGGYERRRNAPAGIEVARMRSPLIASLVPILRDSNNSVADQLFLACGAVICDDGSHRGGERASRLALKQLGLDASGFTQADGSGLSKDNRVSARQLAELIDAVLGRKDDLASLFLEALPVAGSTGKLAARMRDGDANGRVHAKTGFINGASSLSGLVRSLGGGQLVFSILVTYAPVSGLNTNCWKPMQDEICELLVKGDERDV